MFISRAHEVNAAVASVEVGSRWGKSDRYREKAANKVGKGGRQGGRGRGGRGRRSRVLAVLIEPLSLHGLDGIADHFWLVAGTSAGSQAVCSGGYATYPSALWI